MLPGEVQMRPASLTEIEYETALTQDQEAKTDKAAKAECGTDPGQGRRGGVTAARPRCRVRGGLAFEPSGTWSQA